VNGVQQDCSRISQVILRWGYFRDHGMWEALLDTFHPDGEIQVTWYKGRFDGFVAASREMARRGVNSRHVMKPSMIDVAGHRAVAITPVSILGRAKAPLGVEVDLASQAQFFDFFERNSEEWRISRRICIYQQDRMDSVGPSLKFWLLSFLLPTHKFDPAYKHLGLVLNKAGYDIQPGQVVDNTDASRKLYQEGQDWLHEHPGTDLRSVPGQR
jgi:hypothetical protein